MGFPVADTGSVTEDTGVVGGFITATGDVNYLLGDDTGDWTAGTIAGSYGALAIDADGVWTYTADNSNPSIQALNSGETLTEVFNVTSTNGATTVTITINGVDEPPCFTRGTLIETPHGPRPVESLRAGDAVLTADNGVQQIRWVGSRRLALGGNVDDEKLRPVRLRAGSIAPGVPDRDLLVSPMHRVLVGGAQSQLLFGRDEVLAPAKHLVNGQSIFTEALAEVEYFHILFDSHQILVSLNLKSESFYPGGVGLAGFEDETREEVLALFPELRSLAGGYGPTARDVLKRHEAQLLRAVLTPPPLLTEALMRRVA
jgi:VCBS repeat-containing protein